MAIEHRITVKAGDGLDFIISDGSRDRHGTRINPNGWDLKAFRDNPVCLWQHGRDPRVGSTPIGKWSNLRVEGGRLIGTFVRAAKGTGPIIDELCSLIEQDILRAVSAGFSVLRTGKPGSDYEFEQQELQEASIVAVGSNKQALKLARSTGVSFETLAIVFGEHADMGRRDVSETGEHAETKTASGTKPAGLPSRSKDKSMKTVSQRLEEAQAKLAAKQQRHAELINAATLDNDEIDSVSAELEILERDVATLKRAEERIAKGAGNGAAAQAVNRRPLDVRVPEVKPADLIVRAGVCHFLSHVSGLPVERILDERYQGHDATAAVVQRTAIAPATTTTSGWASQLVETGMSEFLSLLPATSIYPVLRSMGVGLTFGPNSGNIKIPFSSSTDALAGGFVLEGDPIPVGRMTLDSVTLAPHKFGIIVPMTKEALKYTNPALESVVRSELLARTSIKLDTLLIDDTVGSATRPAGLRYGVAKVGNGYGGGDYVAFLEDIKALMAPFDSANAGRSMALLMNRAQARNVRVMAGPNNSGFGWAGQFLSDFRVIVSTTVPAGTVIAIDTADFVTSTGDAPVFEASDQATIHMSDTPAPIVASASTADPVRSMFQTNSVALKMGMDVSWAMRRAGMVQWIENVTW